MSTWSNRTFETIRLLRFAAVGLLNTALGYAIILAGLTLGYGDIPSNILGYAAGLVLGFILNRRWTFSDTPHLRRGATLRYAVSFAVAYGANLTIILAALSFGFINNPWVHLTGICVYSGLFYLASSRFVFVSGPVRGGTDHTVF